MWTGFMRMLGYGATEQRSGPQSTDPIRRVHRAPSPVADVDAAMQISAVWACVELITETIASLPVFVYRDLGEGRRELARDEPIFTLLHKTPNPRHTAMEFWQFLAFNFILRGNAYARIGRGVNGDVVALWPLSSDQVRVELLTDGSVIYHYTYDGKAVVYSSDSILHWRDKGNGIVGLSRLEYMRASLGVAIAAQDQNGRLYANDSKRPGIFMIDKLLTDKQREQIRSNFRGLVEAGEDDLLILEAGAKWEPLQLTPQETQLLETRRFAIEDIARWFGITSVLINDTAKTTTWGTGVQQLVEGFVKFKLRPLVRMLEQAVEARVFTNEQKRRLTVEFSLDALLRSNLKERADIYAKLVQNGLKTRNECRQLENDPPMEGGDILTAQTNLAPLDELPGISGGEEDVSQDAIAQ
jgi:HK97 family phage portal protein